MNNIDKDLIKVLRKRTNISLIKCKQALIESNGDIELAIDNLRKSGLKVNFNSCNRLTPAGVIVTQITSDQKQGCIVEVNCETDFVSKNSIFQEFSKTVINILLRESIANIDILRERCERQRLILINQVNENIYLNRLSILTGSFINSYVHGSKIGVIVSASGNIDINIMKHIAMHIAARNPKYICLSNVPDSVLNREYNIQKDIVKKSMKSTKFLEKIVEGRIKKFMNEIVLTEQEFILDTDKNVGSVLNKHGIKIDRFIRFEIGRYD